MTLSTIRSGFEMVRKCYSEFRDECKSRLPGTQAEEVNEFAQQAFLTPTPWLPDEMWVHIFSYLKPKNSDEFKFSWCHVRLVNKCFNRVIGEMLAKTVSRERLCPNYFGIKNNYKALAVATILSPTSFVCVHDIVTTHFIGQLVEQLPMLSYLDLRLGRDPEGHLSNVSSFLPITRLSQLQKLKLGYSLRGELWKLLENINNPLLSYLEVHGWGLTHMTETNKIVEISQRLPNLHTLKLSSFHHMSDRFCDTLGASVCAKNLKNLIITKGVTTIGGLKRLMTSLVRLQKLTLYGFSDDHLETLGNAPFIHQITHLNIHLEGNSDNIINDNSIASLTAKMLALQVFLLRNRRGFTVGHITEAVLTRLMQHPNALNLSVNEVPTQMMISATTLALLAENNLFNRFNKEREGPLQLLIARDIPLQTIWMFLNSFTKPTTRIKLWNVGALGYREQQCSGSAEELKHIFSGA